MKFNITSVIPTVQYGNIQPSLEIEAPSYEEALLIADKQLASWWDKYYNNVPTSGVVGDFKELKAFCGGNILYDSTSHTYMWEGVKYLSGSEYAESFKKPFDGQAIAKRMADKVGANPEDILKMWALKGQSSRDFGSAIHAALEMYERYGELATRLDKTYNLHDHPVIKSAVESFFESHKGEKAMSEVLVVDHDKRRAGQIDRLLITSRKHCRVQDFKTGTTVKDLEYYWKQLTFYGEILEAGGWVVEGYDVFHFDGGWETHTL